MDDENRAILPDRPGAGFWFTESDAQVDDGGLYFLELSPDDEEETDDGAT